MDVYDKNTRSQVMRRVKANDTGPEMVVRRLLHHAGYRYNVHRADLPGKPDIVFPRRKKAVLIHGCFWHQHEGCPRANRPSSNTDYWENKLDRNLVRDSSNLRALQYGGWQVMVVWECEIRDTADLLSRLSNFLNG